MPVSEGYKIFNNANAGWSSDGSGNGMINNINLSNLSELQITLTVQKNEPNSGSTQQVLTLNISDNSGNSDQKDIRLTQSTPQTIVVDVSNWSGTSINMAPSGDLNNYQVQYKVESIKAIYK